LEEEKKKGVRKEATSMPSTQSQKKGDEVESLVGRKKKGKKEGPL